MSLNTAFNDGRLQSLATEPAEDLCPAMKSASAAAPWIVLLAFLPPLGGIQMGTLDDRSAAWGLQAIDAFAQLSTQSTVSSSASPPLATWMTTFVMFLFGVDSPASLVAVSYLAAAGTVLSAAKFAQRFGPARLGLLTAICCAGHPLLLNAAHLCSPEALGICFLTLALERFLAHLDGSVGVWSGRLFAAGLAWGASWLAIGWPALALGAALAIHAMIYREPRHPGQPTQVASPRFASFVKFRSSLVVWGIAGGLVGSVWLLPALANGELTETFQWLRDPAPNPISPLYPSARKIALWGETAGATFLWGWIAIGLLSLLGNRRDHANRRDGRHIALLLFWLIVLICRVAAAMIGADPTVWDVLQIVPACVTAALGMELVLDRTVSGSWLTTGIVIGLASLAIHLPQIDAADLRWPLLLGGAVGLTPVVVNLAQERSWLWREGQLRRALVGLLVSTWLAHGTWGIVQSLPESMVDAQLSERLAKVKASGLEPGAIVIVADASPSRSLELQFRRRWPLSPLVTADRWETAVSEMFRVARNWADCDFLVAELTRRESQFRRPGNGWIVSPVSEPRRYYGDKLTLNKVSVQSP
jgi:hypothetical protein